MQPASKVLAHSASRSHQTCTSSAKQRIASVFLRVPSCISTEVWKELPLLKCERRNPCHLPSTMKATGSLPCLSSLEACTALRVDAELHERLSPPRPIVHTSTQRLQVCTQLGGLLECRTQTSGCTACSFGAQKEWTQSVIMASFIVEG